MSKSTPPAGPFVTLSAIPDADWLGAALPLLEEGAVEALEWGFDCGWYERPAPGWIVELADHFSAGERLFGHGVTFSILSAVSTHHGEWLENLGKECAKRRYLHISEHFGMMRTRNFHRGAPLPVPYDPALVKLAVTRLTHMKQLSGGTPIGLENLALAFSADDVRAHSSFILEMIEPVDGFYLLDLHNLYCQSQNFQIPLRELIALFPPERVRELHVSGGSWSEITVHGHSSTVRRDTHDDRVPEELFEVLPFALARFPGLRAVTFEQLGTSLRDEASREGFRDDFYRLRQAVQGARHG